MKKVVKTSWGQTVICIPKNKIASHMFERLKELYKESKPKRS